MISQKPAAPTPTLPRKGRAQENEAPSAARQPNSHVKQSDATFHDPDLDPDPGLRAEQRDGTPRSRAHPV